MEVRISGINIPIHKHAEVALTAVFGIGRSTAKKICQAAGVSSATKIKELTEADVDAIRNEVGKLTTEGELRRKVSMDIKRKVDIGSYAGLRHKRGLPLKARTRTNARTRKGKRRGVISMVKKESK